MVLSPGPTWSSGSRSPPTTSATSRCRCSTPTPWSPAGRWRSARGAAIVPARFSASRFLADVRHYGATYMNYVGKPLAYVLATPERPTTPTTRCGSRSATRPATATSRSSRRRFDCHVMDGFGSTELAIIVTRARARPRGSIGQGVEGGRDLRLRDRHRVRRWRSSTTTGALAQRRRGDRRAGEHRRAPACSRATTTTRPPTTSGCGTACTGPATSPTATRTASIYLAGRTADWMRVDGENLAAAPDRADHPAAPGGQPGRACTPCPTTTSATR